MFKSVLKTLVCGMAFASAAAAANVPREPVYFESGQYSASLAQGAHRWRLQPLTGDVVDVIDRACVNNVHLPHGVWLVSRDADGNPQLVAPSSTALPQGFPEQIALRACNGPGASNALQVPAVVLDWIVANANSVMIDG